jgi:hypothetical protein
VVKKLLLTTLLTASLFGAETATLTVEEESVLTKKEQIVENNTLTKEERLDAKVLSFIGEESYEKNRDYIHINFKNVDSFYIQDRINVVKVVETLEENGLLHLFFEEPQQYEMTFHSTGDALFFVKLMGDTLRDIGYYRYVTKESVHDESGFEWKISLEAEYVTDPVLLRKELATRGCEIIDIVRQSATDWHYNIDTSKAHLKVDRLESGIKKKYNRIQYAKWLDVADIKAIDITSHRANYWYPYIALYDSSLRLLKVIKQDEETTRLNLKLPEETRYISVSDLYTITNIRYGLEFSPSGKR